MSQLSTTLSPDVSAGPAVRRIVRMYMELTKARLSAMVVVTAAVGYLIAARGRVEPWALLWLVLGTALAAACANAFNQVMETDRDARMSRTARRPLPSGRMSVLHAAVAAVLMGGVGLTILAAMLNGLTAALGLLTIAVYLLIYTPLKVRSTLNTVAGAVVGAVPPMMGWAAARGSLEAGAWALGAILFVWQVPHFLALAWIYRKDYELGGYRMLTSADPTGAVTCRTVLFWSAALVPVALAAAFVGVAGQIYIVSALALGMWLVYLSARLHQQRTHDAARRLFFATLAYLPLLMGIMVFDPPARSAREIAVSLPVIQVSNAPVR